MKKLFVISNIILSLALSGCGASTGRPFLEEACDSEIVESLVKNVTTKEQVKCDFGEPEEVNFDRGSEKWVYSFKRSEDKGVNFMPRAGSFYQGSSDTIKHLRIFFNPRGILEKYTFSSSQGATKFWFSDLSAQKGFQLRNHGFFSEDNYRGKTYNSSMPDY